jgi:hypothetical protein
LQGKEFLKKSMSEMFFQIVIQLAGYHRLITAAIKYNMGLVVMNSYVGTIYLFMTTPSLDIGKLWY